MPERTPTQPLTAPILVYAARYALGRRTPAPRDVEEAIAVNLAAFKRDAGCRETLIQEILETENLGDSIDREAWMRTLGRLESCRG